jgi:hypothetical protein
LAAFATVLPEAMGIANTMSGKTRQQISEEMNAMLRMSASCNAGMAPAPKSACGDAIANTMLSTRTQNQGT